VKHVL
jgi:hypothetical protein